MFRHTTFFAVTLGSALLLAACGKDDAHPPQARPVMVVQPQRAAAAVTRYPGEVRARHEPELAFRIGGKVVERLVEIGERVRKDQPLARLDPQDVHLQLAGIGAQRVAAEANLRVARAERDRYATLQARQLVSYSQYDSAENAFRAAEARLQQVRAEQDLAGNQLEYAQLRAPGDGVIARRQVEAGQVVAAGQTVFVLAADGEREVAIDLPEQALARYRIGQQVTVALWSQPGRQYAGRIRELSPAADARSRTFSARVAFDEGGVPAELGQSAQVSIAAASEAALAVPLSALTAERGRHYLWRVRPDATLEKVTVRIGAFDERSVAVLEGLRAEDWIVQAGVQMLHGGQAVRPRDRNNRPVALAQE